MLSRGASEEVVTAIVVVSDRFCAGVGPEGQAHSNGSGVKAFPS